MIGGVSQWPALVLLLVCAAAPAAAAEGDDLTLVSMDWTYVVDTGTTLTVCTDEILLGETFTLNVTNSASEELSGSPVEDNHRCAKFETSDNKPLSAGMTTYELSTISRSGSVSFSLERATITCGSSTFLRFNPDAGTVDDGTCINSLQDLGSVCYVAEEDFTSEPICFTWLDEDQSDFKVCIQGETFVALTPIEGSLTADELKYDGGSFTFTYDSGNPSLAELLILSDGSFLTVASCEANTCVDDTFAPSIAYYDLCGVFVDTNDMAVSSGEASFQDTDLRVDTVEPTVDFHFIKVEDNEVYLVSGLDVNYDPIDEVNDVTLDCSYITPGTICNGFFAANDKIKNVAVSYEEKTNTIIAQVPETRTFQIRNHLP